MIDLDMRVFLFLLIALAAARRSNLQTTRVRADSYNSGFSTDKYGNPVGYSKYSPVSQSYSKYSAPRPVRRARATYTRDSKSYGKSAPRRPARRATYAKSYSKYSAPRPARRARATYTRDSKSYGKSAPRRPARRASTYTRDSKSYGKSAPRRPRRPSSRTAGYGSRSRTVRVNWSGKK